MLKNTNGLFVWRLPLRSMFTSLLIACQTTLKCSSMQNAPANSPLFIQDSVQMWKSPFISIKYPVNSSTSLKCLWAGHNLLNVISYCSSLPSSCQPQTGPYTQKNVHHYIFEQFRLRWLLHTDKKPNPGHYAMHTHATKQIITHQFISNQGAVASALLW